MTTFHRAWPAKKIIIYTDIDVEPLAVEYPDGGGVAHGGVGGDGGGVAAGDGGVGGDGGGMAASAGVDVGGLGGDALKDEIDLDSDDDENDDEEDVEDVEGEDDDDNDWLNEGLEGADFGDDVFVT